MDFTQSSIHAADRGVLLGRQLALMAMQAQKAYSQEANHQDLRRFPKRTSPTLPSREEWKKVVHFHTVFCLHIFKVFNNTTASLRDSTYGEVLKHISNSVKGMGVVSGNHFLGEKSCLGLLPAWIREHAEIRDDSRAVTYFQHKYGRIKQLRGEGLRRFSKDVRATIADRFGVPVSVRKVENIFCKVYWLMNGKDNMWHDMLLSAQPLFRFPTEKICEVVTADGNVVVLDGPNVINLFPMGDGLETMVGIVERL